MKRLPLLLLIACGPPPDPVVGASCAEGPRCKGDSAYVCEGTSATTSIWKLKTCPKCVLLNGDVSCS